MRRFLMTVCVCTASVVAWPAAQQAPPTSPQAPSQLIFRAETNYVEVDAVVTDVEGNFVPGLTRDDFQVLEDRKPQDVSVFSLVNIPIEHPDPPLYRTPNGSRTTGVGGAKAVIEPDVVTNEKPFDGRIYLLVLDCNHVAAQRTAQVQKQARLFIERYMGENDLAAVVHIGNIAAGQEFTSNRRLLLASIDRFMGQGLHSATEDILKDENAKRNVAGIVGSVSYDPGNPEDTEAPERAALAQESVRAVQQVAETLAELSGRRKALLLFSEGIDVDTSDAPASSSVSNHLDVGSGRQVFIAETAMIAAATRSNVSIYSIDPRGLTTGTEDILAMGPTPSYINDDGGTGNANSAFMMARQQRIGNLSNPTASVLDEVARAQESLRAFADQTGGRALVNVNDIAHAFDQLVEENSSYYVLGYHSPDGKRDGAYHSVSVKMTRPGLEVRTRKGYYAPSGKASTKPVDPVTSLITSPTQVAGLGMHISANVLKDAALRDTVHLTLEFNGTDLTLTQDPKTGTFNDDIVVEYDAFDASGHAKSGARQTVHLRLKPATQATVAGQGVRWVTEFQVPPGRYQLRLAGREVTGSRTGSVFYDLYAPDFAKPALAMSDVLLTSSVVFATATGGVAPRGVMLLPGLTTTQREWHATDKLMAAAEIYDNNTAHPHGVDITATVHADDGTQVFTADDARQTAASDTLKYAVTIPLKSFSPGRYVLTIEATSRLGGPPATREIEFRIK